VKFNGLSDVLVNFNVKLKSYFPGVIRTSFSTLSPFAYRIGLPWLVGTFFADDPLTGFRLINLVFGCLTLLLLHRFLRHYLTSNTVILLLILLYVVNPNSPFRLVHFYPATTDPPALFLVLLILHLSNKFKAIKLRQSLLLMGMI